MKLRVGKIRGLQQISTSDGVFIICALDHRNSLKKLFLNQTDKKVTYEDMVNIKLELCEIIAPHVSAILLDPEYGATQCILKGALPGNKGLLVSVEDSGYKNVGKGRLNVVNRNWGVSKIKSIGASAVKMLVFYRPELRDIAKKQLELVKKVALDCIKYDIAFLVEPMSYPIEEKGTPEYFASKKSEIVIETARQMSELPIDVLKAEFPGDIMYIKDQEKLLDQCYKLTEAIKMPWVLLSAGVGYEQFRFQVEIACKGGASGFLGGRAIWQDVIKIVDKDERREFLQTTVVSRLKELSEIVYKYANPWYKKIKIEYDSLANFQENWYRFYR